MSVILLETLLLHFAYIFNKISPKKIAPCYAQSLNHQSVCKHIEYPQKKKLSWNKFNEILRRQNKIYT